MRRRHRLCVTLLLLLLAAPPRARAFLVFNEGRDQFFINATYTIGYDTNVFLQKIAQGSYTQSMTCSLNYLRHAGVISVNATLGASINQFGDVHGQNTIDPNFDLTLTKGVGRTTGSLDFNVQRESAPDPLANARPISWDYATALDLRYPVNDRYYFTSVTSATGSAYQNQVLFADLDTYSENLDINYIYDSKLDLLGGVLTRYSDTSGVSDEDYALNFGANGSILPKLSGSVSTGYEEEVSDTKVDGHSLYDNVDAGINLFYRYSPFLGFNEAITKDFSVTSTDIETNALSVSTSADATLGRRWRTSAGLTFVNTVFLGKAGAGRRDWLWEVPLNVGTALTPHLKVNLTYMYEVNYSTLASAEFVASTISLTIQASY